MKIVIDTQEESAESLKQLATFLNTLAGNQPVTTSSSASTSDDEVVDMPSPFGLFDEDGDDDDSSDEYSSDEVVEQASADDGFRIVPY